jgi:hypothetical protein
MSAASGVNRFHRTNTIDIRVTLLRRRYYLEKVRCLSAHRCTTAYRDRKHHYAGYCGVLGKSRGRSRNRGSTGRHCGALAAGAECRGEAVNLLTQIMPTFWTSYGAAMIALIGFLLNGLLAYGGAQKLAGQREEQRAIDQAWKKEHVAQSNVRDIAIAALQAMGNSNEATVKGIQGQLLLIQTELQALRNRHAGAKN